ncbi:MAG: RIP metalloprotease RseP [Candidatus Omnitrophica bacterium]|nr:RIP metalloprotease RseP [Candidatus Omnitrophota bacterium]
MINILIFIFILSLMIIVHELGHYLAARRVGVRVEKFSLGFGPLLFNRKKNDTQYCISAIPLGGFVKLAGDNPQEYKGQPDEYFSKPVGKRFQIIFFGPLLNYLLGFIFFWFIFFAGYPTLTTEIGTLLEGYGAKQAGLATGDKIISIDGKNVRNWEELQAQIQSKKGAAGVSLVVVRQEKEFNIDVPLKAKEVENVFGKKINMGLIGITPADKIIKVRHGFFASFFLGAKKTLDLTVMTYQGLWYMATGKLSMRESVTGPLGIFYITSKAAGAGIIVLMHLVAILSVSLAIFNLLPLPVLDGGHILLLGLEKVRGKGLSIKSEQVFTQIGTTLIISLAILVTYNDIVRFFGDKISNFFK